MNGVSISWYLSGLFLAGLVFSSAITVVPGRESFIAIVMTISGICPVLFGGIAIYLKRLSKCNRANKSKWILNLYLVFAIIMTLFILLFVVG